MSAWFAFYPFQSSPKVLAVHFKNVDQIPDLLSLVWRDSSWIAVVSVYRIIRYCHHQTSTGLNYWFSMIVFLSIYDADVPALFI